MQSELAEHRVILILVMLELLSLRIELMLNSGRESLLDMLLMLYIMLWRGHQAIITINRKQLMQTVL